MAGAENMPTPKTVDLRQRTASFCRLSPNTYNIRNVILKKIRN